MDIGQTDCIDEPKIPQDVQHDSNNVKSVKNIGFKKNITESDNRTSKRKNDISNFSTVKKKKKYETALAAIFPENDQSYLQYAQDYADGYMKKMRERLDPKSLELASNLLVSFGVADDKNINLLYQQITELFTDKNEDLTYEFLGFLLPGQALTIGKFSDYLELTRIKEFIRKLQVCMKKQPIQVRKVLDNIFNLSKSETITPFEVHTVMLPLLKSNPILVDCFFQLIPTEKPPASFFSGDNWEDLDIDNSINYGIDYEEIIPSDSEDQTQLNVCHCTCHKLGDISHCTSCGLKFFKGRIYFDTPEGLKLAKIRFEGADSSIVQSKIDKSEVNITVKQKTRKNLIKNSSPGSAEDIKCSTGTESEEDLIEVKPKKRQKSKVVQSLKLKFKKEESPKCKDDQETLNEIGKSIVHVTNEELNSSEMVFFCIPTAESNVKILPKIKTKHEAKEIPLSKKESETVNPINSVILSYNNLNTVVSGKNMEIDKKFIVDINIVGNEVQDIKTEDSFKPTDIIANNLTTKIIAERNFAQPTVTSSNTVKGIESNILPSAAVNSLTNEIKTEMVDIADVLENNIKQYQTSINIKEELTHELSVSDEHSINLNESDKQVVKNEFIQESEICNSNIKIEHVDQNIQTTSTNLDSTAVTISDNKSLFNKNLIVQNKCTEITESSLSIPDTNKPLFDENVTLKSKTIESLPECFIDVMKNESNESDKQLINKWTIDEDKIILQTCKRVEDIEVLLETIKRRIPQRSVSEIQERFTTLMTLLEQMIDVRQN